MSSFSTAASDDRTTPWCFPRAGISLPARFPRRRRKQVTAASASTPPMAVPTPSTCSSKRGDGAATQGESRFLAKPARNDVLLQASAQGGKIEVDGDGIAFGR